MNELLLDPIDLGDVDRMSAVDRLVSVSGLKVVDIGCGDGRSARQLVERGAEVLAVEPDPIQAKKNRATAPVPGLTFVEAPGQNLPVADASMDGVFFFNSLHHVPAAHMDAALMEAVRVLKPTSGFLFVLEPLLSGTMDAVYRPFHDESRVRALAYEALKRTAKPRFKAASEYRYGETVRYDSFEAFITRQTGNTYNSVKREQVDILPVRALFDKGKTTSGYVFSKFSRVNLFRGPRG